MKMYTNDRDSNMDNPVALAQIKASLSQQQLAKRVDVTQAISVR